MASQFMLLLVESFYLFLNVLGRRSDHRLKEKREEKKTEILSISNFKCDELFDFID